MSIITKYKCLLLTNEVYNKISYVLLELNERDMIMI